MASEKVLLGLDIGSSWVRAVVGSVSKDGQLMVDSICERASEGVKNGVIVNPEKTVKNIISVIQEAELQAGTEAQSVVVGMGGSSIECRQSEGVAGITTKGLEISSADIYKSLEIARTFELPPDRVILHTLVQDFSVDGQSGIKDPTDMTGHRLESRALVVTGSSANFQNTKKCLQKANLNNSRITLTQLADAEVVLSSDDKEMGVILINLGSSCTNMIVYRNGSPEYVGGIDLGSSNVTSDISDLFQKPKAIAEQVKTEAGCCYLPSVNTDESIIIPGVPGSPAYRLPKKELCRIIEPRMAEIFSILKHDLEERNIRGPFGAGVVLVGGGSLLSGATELAQEIFKVPARIGFPEALAGLDRTYINPKYTTVLGLLKTEAKKSLGGSKTSRKRSIGSSDRTSIFQKVSNFLKTVI